MPREPNFVLKCYTFVALIRIKVKKQTTLKNLIFNKYYLQRFNFYYLIV